MCSKRKIDIRIIFIHNIIPDLQSISNNCISYKQFKLKRILLQSFLIRRKPKLQRVFRLLNQFKILSPSKSMSCRNFIFFSVVTIIPIFYSPNKRKQHRRTSSPKFRLPVPHKLFSIYFITS